MKQSGNTILITGGGSGIGEALAHRFHDMGNKVIIAGRRSEALSAAAAGRKNIHALRLDIDNAGAVKEFISRVLSDHADLNIVINNAGIMRYEDILHRRNLAEVEAMLSTNVLGPIRMINGFVEHLVTQKDAAIINVTSGLAFVPLVLAPTYSATKAALHSYTVSLREALKDKIEVIELIPPAVQTDLTPGQATREGYQPLGEFIEEVMACFTKQPTAPEILVERVKFLRNAEMENRFTATLTGLNEFVRTARQKS